MQGAGILCPSNPPGVWLVLSKVTFLVTGLLQRGHGEGLPVSGTEGGDGRSLSGPSSYVLIL